MELDELLNKNQKEAATYLDSHLRIIAGAGSGKTRVVTYRIAYLIDEIGVDPRKILAITFTNKAANEMKERITSLLGPHALGSLVCTIHSLCVRILRRHINVINYPSNFMIMDEEDQKALIKKIYNKIPRILIIFLILSKIVKEHCLSTPREVSSCLNTM